MKEKGINMSHAFGVRWVWVGLKLTIWQKRKSSEAIRKPIGCYISAQRCTSVLATCMADLGAFDCIPDVPTN